MVISINQSALRVDLTLTSTQVRKTWVLRIPNGRKYDVYSTNNRREVTLLSKPGHASQSDTEELLPLDLMFRSKMFPLKSSTDVDNKIRMKVREYLPPRAESWRIVEEHYEYSTWRYEVCSSG